MPVTHPRVLEHELLVGLDMLLRRLLAFPRDWFRLKQLALQMPQKNSVCWRRTMFHSEPGRGIFATEHGASPKVPLSGEFRMPTHTLDKVDANNIRHVTDEHTLLVEAAS